MPYVDQATLARLLQQQEDRLRQEWRADLGRMLPTILKVAARDDDAVLEELRQLLGAREIGPADVMHVAALSPSAMVLPLRFGGSVAKVGCRLRELAKRTGKRPGLRLVPVGTVGGHRTYRVDGGDALSIPADAS